MRLHAKLLGNNPFCIFPIWLVYCTFKRTERINTLYEQVWIQSNTENPGLWGLCYSVWDCRDAVCQLLHIPTTRTAETGLQVPKVPYRNRGLNMPLLYSPAGWASLATLCKSHNMVQFYTSDATPDNKSQELWSMAKRKPQTNKTEKDARFWQVSTFCPITV